MTLPPRYWPAVGWTFLGGLIGALCALIPLMVIIPLVAMFGFQAALVAQSVGMLILTALLTAALMGGVIGFFEAFFVRMFYRSRLQVEIGLGQAMVTLIGFSIASVAITTVGGMILGPFAIPLGIALSLLGPPWWLLRSRAPGAGPVASDAAVSVMVGQATASPSLPAGGQDAEWASWTIEAIAMATRVDVAATDAVASGDWQPMVALRDECGTLVASAPFAAPAIEVQAQVREIGDALRAVSQAGSIDQMRSSCEMVGMSLDRWRADVVLVDYVRRNRIS